MMADRAEHAPNGRRVVLWVRWGIGVLAGLGGAMLTLAITALGHCSAFGGTCPAEPEPLLQNDVFGSVTATVALTVWVVSVCVRPSRRGVVTGLVIALPAGLISGLAAVASTSG